MWNAWDAHAVCDTRAFADEVLRKALWLKIAVFAIEDGKTIKPAIDIMKV